MNPNANAFPYSSVEPNHYPPVQQQSVAPGKPVWKRRWFWLLLMIAIPQSVVLWARFSTLQEDRQLSEQECVERVAEWGKDTDEISYPDGIEFVSGDSWLDETRFYESEGAVVFTSSDGTSVHGEYRCTVSVDHSSPRNVTGLAVVFGPDF
ncbi:hypothetical protein KBP53_02620 [Corynebacterium genitalium ATCC 33030]|nr:hypothetical protein [Corynebacterium genitalium]UUA89883.1 hypothetical protein KBP53_02620 [Corynebacterium genitalium ATCC 33030]